MKKIFALILSVIICVLLIACDGADEDYVVITDENGETVRVEKDETGTDSDTDTDTDTDDDLGDIVADGGDDGDDNKNWTANY